MPRLNLNVEFGHGYSSYSDWYYYDDDNWEENDNFFEEVGLPKHFVDFPMAGENYPSRGHMKNKYNYWGYKNWVRVNDTGIFEFIGYVIENNIGKSFSNAFRYFCKFAKPYHQKYFLQEFDNYTNIKRARYRYWIDENNLIQGHKNRHKHYNKRNEDKSCKTFISHDYGEVWEIEVVEKENWGKKDKTYTIVRTVPKGDMWAVQREFNYRHKLTPLRMIGTKGLKETFDKKNSTRYQKLRQEDNKIIRKLERQKQREIKNKIYSLKPSFLTQL